MPEPRSAKATAERRLVQALAVAAALFALVAGLSGETFYLRLATEALILAGLAVSVDVLLGYTGLLSLGQALFFGAGAYVSALLLRDAQAGFWLAVLGSVAITLPLACICAAIAIRARGVYFVLITFGLAQVAAKVVYNTQALGASDGLIGVPVVRADFLLFALDLSDPVSFFLLIAAVTLAACGGLGYLMRSPFGRTLLAIRSNEARVPFLGFRPAYYKVASYVVAAETAALFGAFYPMLRGFVAPELMFFETSGNAVIAAIIGGVGTLIGPVYGSVILVVAKSLIGSFTEYHVLVIGTLFALSVIFLPRGLAGLAVRVAEARPQRGDGGS